MMPRMTNASPVNGEDPTEERQLRDYFAYRGHLRTRQSVFAVCFFLFCVIDQLLGSAPGEIHGILIKCVGLVTAVLILNSDSKAERLSPLTCVPYIAWGLLFFFAVRKKALETFGPDVSDIFGWLTGYGENPLTDSIELIEWIILACNIGVYGIIIIRTVLGYVVSQRLPRMNWPLFAIWFILLTGMLLSRNESSWPLCFLILFGCFYLTEYSRDELLCLVNGMLNGVITAFFVFLVFSSFFRSFDTVGYCGMYVQYQRNALFYLCAHTAFLGKWYQMHKSGAGPVRKAVCLAGCCFAAGYGMITTVRLVIYLMFVNTLITLLFIALAEQKQRILKALGRLLLILALTALATPCAYWIARYMPYYYTSPLVYSTDNYDEKVLFLSTWSLNRYTTVEELTTELTGQLFRYEDPTLQEIKEQQALNRRYTLDAYFHELNFQGHSNEESAFWVTDILYALHCQNIFLHMAYTFGVPVGLIFFLFYLIVGCFLCLRCLKKNSSEWCCFPCLLFLFSALAYGFFDRNWMVGQLPFLLLFIVPYPAMHRTINPKDNPFSLPKGGNRS